MKTVPKVTFGDIARKYPGLTMLAAVALLVVGAMVPTFLFMLILGLF